MFDIQLAVSAIIFAIGIGVFLSMVIVLIISLTERHCYVANNKGCIIAAIIGLVIGAISLFFVIKYYKLSTSPEVIHQGLLNDLDKAEKELQKFYIDHPEFKENE